ncbi:hypothetical protein BPULL_1558 [Bifidobacterium pullorum]|uniref:Uncharacterized protein n=1 Tax=Bifidobacterium pullorum TaxID=78448 RepID=A0A7V8KQJ8_9BIFI|nr:hypothetical protein BPULL_1558 [Bifidobacterium pullorum]
MQMNDMNGGFDEPDFDGEDPGTGSANGEKPGKDRWVKGQKVCPESRIFTD